MEYGDSGRRTEQGKLVRVLCLISRTGCGGVLAGDLVKQGSDSRAKLTCNELERLGDAFLIVGHDGRIYTECWASGDGLKQRSASKDEVRIERRRPEHLRIEVVTCRSCMSIRNDTSLRAASSLAWNKHLSDRHIMRSTQFLGMRPTRTLLRPVPVS